MNLIIIAILFLFFLCLLLSALSGFSAAGFKAEDGDLLIEQVDALLPQTQCGQCGHPGCRPYAEAIAKGEPINKCPPGGQTTIDALASLLGVEAVHQDAEYGIEQEKKVAFIREQECIGCTKCIKACPVDAIVGASRQMHTVIISECTGCDLCVEPCPVDCIDMRPVPKSLSQWQWKNPENNIENTSIIATNKSSCEAA